MEGGRDEEEEDEEAAAGWAGNGRACGGRKEE